MSHPTHEPAGPPGLDRGAIEALAEARHGDPFAVLGPGPILGPVPISGPGRRRLVVIRPDADEVGAVAQQDGRPLGVLARVHPAGIFAGTIEDAPYRLVATTGQGTETVEDPYRFGPILTDEDLRLIRAGHHPDLPGVLGARVTEIEGVAGTVFAVWAPNADRVSVIGDFNEWDGRRHPMRLRHAAGVWELFLPGIGPGRAYRYEIRSRGGAVLQKADPMAQATEMPPGTASIVPDPTPFPWTDGSWMARRATTDLLKMPVSVYEVHAASWFRDAPHPQLDWDGLADRLIPYVRALGFTHVELLPVMEHPFGGSWGYQPLGLFAPSARFGRPRGFARFVDRCHAAGIGVILDWVPAHFPMDPHGLFRFDGTALYEHEDPREGIHRDWNTAIYNHGRDEVAGFLIASALYWLEHYHVDGLRVDAVASMLYRDYSREAGDWVPNIHGGRENLETVAFLRRMNQVIQARVPGAMTIAEESTAWPGVTAPVAAEGSETALGFTLKWNMGWMHDSLKYMGEDPINRRWHHGTMTFSLVYAWSERYVLPLSHDEVVHGKGSLLGRMPGDDWQKRANLRAYLAFMWGHPGRKLIFAGGELGNPREWDHDGSTPWGLLDDAGHQGIQALVADLNRLYAHEPALHGRDDDPGGFQWVVGDDAANSVFAWIRRTGEEATDPDMLVVANLTPVPREAYRIGVPAPGIWHEVLNTDATAYGGSGLGNGGRALAVETPAHGRPASLTLTLPPLATLMLRQGR
ncbi:1,4-alpha-glucan branching protein GlgB [Tistrella mobilis]|uniref:1,4-alpha-glucan branching protein GlgB n=1 Tax=Tistrella mobilis TaxID=171437 RepID=UPI0031F678C2